MNRIWKNLDRKTFIKLEVKPLGLFLFILITVISLHKLNFPSEQTYTGASDLRLEIGLQTASAKLEQLVAGIRGIIESRKEIEEASVFVSEITSHAIVVQSDYYTAPITIKEFNAIRQDVNIRALKLLEDLQVEVAGARTDIRLEGALSGSPSS